jgi:hypothetical protein
MMAVMKKTKTTLDMSHILLLSFGKTIQGFNRTEGFMRTQSRLTSIGSKHSGVLGKGQ